MQKNEISDTIDYHRPQVSVIICIYNSERYIAQCVESLMKQTLQDIEFIFIDDASTDQTSSLLMETLAKYPERLSQVRIIHHSTNEGISKSRIEGVSLCRGEWIIHCDSDDIVPPESYEILLSAAKSTGADIIGCSCRVFGETFTAFDKHEPTGFIPADSLYSAIGGSEKRSILGTLWNKLIRRELWQNVDLPEGLSYCEDIFSLFQILDKDPKIYYVPDILYNYRMYSTSLIGSKDERMVRQCEIAIPFLDEYKKNLDGVRRSAVNARIVFFLYRLLKSGRMTRKHLHSAYGSYSNLVGENSCLNPLELLHLKLALTDNPLEGLVGQANDVGYRLIKKLKGIIKK